MSARLAAPDNGPALGGRFQRFYHRCGAPLSVELDGQRIQSLEPVVCRCGEQVYSTGLRTGAILRRVPT